MKAKKYRLETVLGLRRRAKDEAAQMVARRFEQLEQAEAELVRRRGALQACYERQNQAQSLMNDEMRRGLQARGVVAHQNYLNDLRQIEKELAAAVEKQIAVVRSAEREVEAARLKLIEAARDVRSIEVHKEGWIAAEREVETRRAQKISDEIGAILHGRRGRT